MEYSFRIDYATEETVVASSLPEALTKLAKLVEAHSEIQLLGMEPVISYPRLSIPAECQVCKIRPTRVVVNMPWLFEKSHSLFICDKPTSSGHTGEHKYECLQKYADIHDNKTVIMPPAVLHFPLAQWIEIQMTCSLFYS